MFPQEPGKILVECGNDLIKLALYKDSFYRAPWLRAGTLEPEWLGMNPSSVIYCWVTLGSLVSKLPVPQFLHLENEYYCFTGYYKDQMR